MHPWVKSASWQKLSDLHQPAFSISCSQIPQLEPPQKLSLTWCTKTNGQRLSVGSNATLPRATNNSRDRHDSRAIVAIRIFLLIGQEPPCDLSLRGYLWCNSCCVCKEGLSRLIRLWRAVINHEMNRRFRSQKKWESSCSWLHPSGWEK